MIEKWSQMWILQHVLQKLNIESTKAEFICFISRILIDCLGSHLGICVDSSSYEKGCFFIV